jgi:hypothetical protein
MNIPGMRNACGMFHSIDLAFSTLLRQEGWRGAPMRISKVFVKVLMILFSRFRHDLEYIVHHSSQGRVMQKEMIQKAFGVLAEAGMHSADPRIHTSLEYLFELINRADTRPIARSADDSRGPQSAETGSREEDDAD